MTKYMTIKRIGTNDDVDYYFTETIASGKGISHGSNNTIFRSK